MNTIALLISLFQNVKSRNQLTRTTEQVLSSALLALGEPIRLPMNRDVSHDGLHPSVPVSTVREASGGSRKSGWIAVGMRFRIDMLEGEKFHPVEFDWL